MSKDKKQSYSSSHIEPFHQTNPLLRWLNSRYAEWILVGSILFLATFLRLWNVNNPLMWLDEIGTICMSTALYTGYENEKCFPKDVIVDNPYNTSSIQSAENIMGVWKFYAERDVNPPLYYTLFYFWRKIFLDSFVALRLTSIIPGIISVLLIYLIAKNIFNKWTGLWSSVIMCLATPQIIYSYEVRQYSFLICLGLCATLLLVKIEKCGISKKRLVLFTLALASLALTHYFSFGFLLGLAVYSAIRFRGRNLTQIATCFCVSGLIFLILWVYPFYHQFFGPNFDFNNFGSLRQNASMAQHLPELLDAWPYRILFGLPIEITSLPSYFIWLCIFPCIAIFWRKNLLLPWLLVFCTVGFLAILDFSRETYHISQIRYTLMAAPAAYIIISAGITTGKHSILMNSILPSIISVFLALNVHTAFKPYKESWYEMANIIKSHGSPNDIIILPHVGASNQLYWPQFIWSALSFYSYNPDRKMALITKPLNLEMLEQVGWGNGAWIFTRIPEFPQAANTNWPSLWVPNCKITGAWLFQERAIAYHVQLPEKPTKINSTPEK